MEQNNKTKRPIRVLVVEDEILVSEWVAQELTEQGFAVQAATNADDAVGHLATQAVDVLFTDLNLPGGMDGAALARRAPAMAQSRRGLCLGARHSARARSAGSRRRYLAEALSPGAGRPIVDRLVAHDGGHRAGLSAT